MRDQHPEQGGAKPLAPSAGGGASRPATAGTSGGNSGRAPNRPPESALGRAGRFAARLVLIVVLASLLPLAVLQFGPVRRMAVGALADVVAGQTGWRLEVRNLEGLWPFNMWLGDVSLSDGQGRWLSVSDVRISVNPWSRSGQFLNLDAAFRQVQVNRMPAAAPAPSPPPGRPLAFLDSLVPIPLAFSAQIEVDELHLDKSVAGRALAMNLSLLARNTKSDQSLKAWAETIDGPATRLEVKAELDPAARSARLDCDLEEAPGGLASELAGLGKNEPLSVRLAGNGPLARWEGSLTATRAGENILDGTMNAALGRSSADDARFGLDLTLRPKTLPLARQVSSALGQKAQLAFKGLITSAGLPAPQWRLLVEELAVSAKAGTARLNGDTGVDFLAPRLSFVATLADPEAVGLGTGPLTVHGEARADIDPTGPITASAEIEAPNLADALGPLKVEIGGGCRLKATLSGDTAKKELSFGIDGGLFELRPGKGKTGEKLAHVLGREVTLRAEARLDPGRTLAFSQTRVKAGGFSAEASGTYGLDSGAIDLGLTLGLGDLSVWSGLAGKTMDGELTATAQIRGTTSAPQISTRLTGAHLTCEAVRFDKAAAEMEAKVESDGSSRGRLSASVSRAKTSLDLSARFAMAGDRLGLTELKLTGPGVNVSGDLDAGLDTATASGHLTAGVDLGRLGAFLNVALSGSARAEAVLAKSGSRQDATVSLSASGVKGFGLIVAKAEVSGTATDVTRAPQGKLAATVTRAKMDAAGLEALNFQAVGNGKEVSFSLKTKGTLPEPFDAIASGVFSPAQGGGRLRLNVLQAGAYGIRAALTQPTSMTVAPDGFTLAGLSMSLGGGRITASGELKGGTVALAAEVRELPLELLSKARVVEDVSGKASARLRMSGTPQSPQVNASVEFSHLRYAGLRGQPVPEVQVSAEAEYSQGKLTSSLRATAGEGATLTARAAIPARLSLRPAGFGLPADATLEASLQGAADLAAMAAFSGQEDLAMHGTLKIDLTARGLLKAPDMSGSIGIDNGDVEYAATGTELRNMVLRIEAVGPRITVQEFSASDGATGRLSANGQMTFPADGRFSLAMDVTLDKAALMRSDMVSAVLSGKLTVSGDPSEVLVKGNLSTGQVQVNIPHRMPPDVTPVKVELVNAPKGLAPSPAPSEEAPGPAPAPLPIKLDMDVNFPGRIFVRGYGLDSVWDGRLHVGGAANSPALSGNIDVVRGRIEFFDKSFDLVRGTVSFTGGPPTTPRLDVDAQYQNSDITADILVTGDAVHPKVNFSSVPAYPQDEILSRVLFGASVSSLTVPQALQLAQAAASFTSHGDALDLMGKTRKLVGLDYLGLGGGTGQNTGNMSITAGKYISDKVYVETSQGLGDQGPKVTVQVQVFPHMTLDSTTGADSKTGVGLNWKMDY